ncbi:septum formation family protein [Nocardioides sp. GY 10127]|uniref:septum formation family protein n=1 Tax=Nocardioides sp. GY 10127 TaxID=2569762 RepID=UPI001457ED78|nr:septum formation family protein [Nocardioides sp. GY 10127]
MTHRGALPALPRLLALLLGLLLGPVLGLLALASPVTAADAWAGAPSEGDCYRATFKQVYQAALNIDAVPCKKTHQVVVLKTGLLPADTDWSDETAVLAEIGDRCDPSFAKVYGSPTTAFRTLYGAFIFRPTDAQLDRGARWYRCDMTLLKSDAALAPLPATLLKVTAANVGRASRRSVGRCVSAKYATTLCSHAHVARATGTFVAKKLSKNDSKAAKQVAKKTKAQCPRLTTTDQWFYSWRRLSATTAVVACFSRTSN